MSEECSASEVRAARALLSETCHSLNNALASVVMAADLLKRHSASAELGAAVRKAAEEALSLIDDTGWFLEGGLAEPAAFRLHGFVRSVEKWVRPRLPTGVSIASLYSPGAPLRAIGRPAALFVQVVALCLGGSDSLAPGDELRIETNTADAPTSGSSELAITLSRPATASSFEAAACQRLREEAELAAGRVVITPARQDAEQRLHLILARS